MDVAEVLSPIRNVEIIASGHGIRIQSWLKKMFGGKRWRKVKGEAFIRDIEGKEYEAEIHWFEAHGIGKRLIRVKKEI
jgi:hypothetical protein